MTMDNEAENPTVETTATAVMTNTVVTGEEEYIFDEPDDELEEFDEIGGTDNFVDPEVAEWDEHWDTTGWDDEDANDDFMGKLQQELEAYQRQQLAEKK
ncbi:hypothetical protein IE077_003720 [Cardiosporidium cionae]|uniref:26S proteasome complex subunit SEM1 n=1 Tax=Cardiosporidium cionae TaxID=476202 RepID=A0ABQ7JEL8_9APIC|nr:hypothetical protein IE077_003720 [Cardiosporidium cionae]|eukprot:KAF8822456.1 hypothetical protein IE077_003720 [Cardiosporidium cionae]